MDVVRIPIAKLKLDPKNARVHDEKNLAAIVGSLTQFGQQKPIVVDGNNYVIAGNGTLVAATRMGWTDIDIVRTDLKGREAKAYALADNRSAELAIWNDQILGEILQELQEFDFDIGSIGFEMAMEKKDADSGDKSDSTGGEADKEFLIVINCRDEAEQSDLYDELNERSFQCKIMS